MIPFENVLMSFIPLIILLLVLFKMLGEIKKLVLASLRMLIQLLGIGYLLKGLFNQESDTITLLVLFFMLMMASLISMNSANSIIEKDKSIQLYKKSFIAMLFGALPTLIFMAYIIIPNENWLSANFIIPLAGMIFSQAMNVMSLACERFLNESKNHPYISARNIALKAALIPITNTFMAVGLVSIPGMMTGQILSGVEPLIAVRYQIIIMTMVFCSVTSSTIIFLLQFRSSSLNKEWYQKA